MANSDILTSLSLFYDSEEYVLICTRDSCRFALSTGPSRVTTHLRDKHHIPPEARKGLNRLLKSLPPPGLKDPDEAPPRPDGSPQHDELRVYEGFACIYCRFRTISLQLIRRHFFDPQGDCRPDPGHPLPRRRRDLDQRFEYVFLQTWTTGSSRKYWIIKRGGSIVRPVDGPGVQAHLQAVLTREFQRQQQDADIPAPPSEAAPSGPVFAEQRPWIERTRWGQTYRDQGRRQVLAALTRTCTSPGGQSYLIGRRGEFGLDEDLVSPCEDEDKIASLIRLLDVLMDRCEETARKTSRYILCWLRSTQTSSTYSKPFTLVRLTSSTTQYRLLLKRCLALVFRVYRMSPETRTKAVGLTLNRKQLRFLDAIWTHESVGDLAPELAGTHLHSLRPDGPDGSQAKGGAGEDYAEHGEYEDEEDEDDDDEDEDEDDDEGEDDDDNEDEDEDKGEGEEDFTAWMENMSETSEDETPSDEADVGPARGSHEELIELLFGLTLALATEPVIDGQPQMTVLIYFSGILGFSSSSDTFLPARSYTTHLSGLIYVLRLLFLEYALPLRPYPSLGIKRRPRTCQVERLQPIRKQYMVMESQSPFEELVSLRNFGRVMSRTDTPAFLLHWSDNGQVVSLGDQISISMGQFRRLPEYFIEEASQLCSEMMFNWDPAIDLSSIKDDMTNNNAGFSFVSHPGNQLATAYLKLFYRASKAHRNGLVRDSDWNQSAIFHYLRKEEMLRAFILGGMLCTGGQLPRCTEILSLYCINGELHPRGIFIYDRSMIYVTRHHKAKRSTNREFVVARFLPAQLGYILFKYLVYIRPFVDMLHRERGLLTNAPDSPFLFRHEGEAAIKPWQTGRLTAILKEATSRVWDNSVNSRQFRQLCIGITEKHVREVYQPFNRFDDKSAGASRNVVFAWQSGHRPLQRGTTYGLDGAYPTKLQPQLLELYRWASSKWHEFLHLPSHVSHRPVDNDPFKERGVRITRLATHKEGGEPGPAALAAAARPQPSDWNSGDNCASDDSMRHSDSDTDATAIQADHPSPIASSGAWPRLARSTPTVLPRPYSFYRSQGEPAQSTATPARRKHQRTTQDRDEEARQEREGEDVATFLRRLHREDEEAFERETIRRSQQATPGQSTDQNRSAKRPRHQRGLSGDAGPHPKRSRPVLSSASAGLDRNRETGLPGSTRQLDQSLSHDDDWRSRPLFGDPSDLLTLNAINDRQAILNRLRGRSDISLDKNLARAQSRVWQLGDQLERWRTVGCQLCFVNGEPGLDHSLDDCTTAGSDQARRLLGWLETLRLERFGPTYGFCSLCHEADELCREWVVSGRVASASSEEGKNHWKQVFTSATGPDGLCNNKPAVRRTIAALCAFDNQILGKTLAKFVSDKYGANLTAEREAAQWFERKVPLGKTWIPQLLIVLDILVAAFDFLQGRRQLSRRQDSDYADSDGSSTSQDSEVPSLGLSWGDEGEAAGWKVMMDWWVGKCSFCAGRGVRGSQIEHSMRQCENGGKSMLRKGLGEAINEEGLGALGGCSGCALPREFCQAWSKDATRMWRRDPKIRCQYGRQAYDTAIGFFYCKNRKYREELMENMADAGLNDFDGEEVAIWLGKKILVAGIEASEIMRQLRWWSRLLWEAMKGSDGEEGVPDL